MGFFKQVLFGKKPKTEVTQVSPYTPSARRVEAPLADFITERIGKGLPSLPDYTERLKKAYTPTDIETVGLSKLGDFLAEEKPAFGEEQGSALTRLLSGETPDYFSPEKLTELFETGYRQPTLRRFREETLPQIRESFIGPGQLFGTARAESERRAQRDVEEGLSSQEAQLQLAGQEKRADLQSQALDRMYRGLSIAPDIAKSLQGFPLEQARAALQMGPLERQLASQELELELGEFIRTRPEASPIIQDALNFLRGPTMETQFDRTAPTKGFFGAGGGFDAGQATDTAAAIGKLIVGGVK